jgi:outer membrane protein assembly factor BamD
MRVFLRYISFCIFLILILGGCSIYNKYFGEKDLTPEELMSEGLKDLDKGNYQSAAEKFQEIKDRYPYSEYAIEAELKIADSEFRNKEYDIAFDAYDEFERMHPRDKNIPYAIYQKGMCHFQQIKTIDREQTHTLLAKEEFERLIKRFPGDEYADRSRKNIRKCLIFLAEHELYVGKFYFKMKQYKAAMGRYRFLIENYPDMGQYHEALEYIRICKEKIAQFEEGLEP